MSFLAGEKCYLRPLEPEDLDVLYNWENNPDVWLVSQTFAPFAKHVLQKYIDCAHEDIFVTKQLRLIICQPDGKPIGCIDLFDLDTFNQRGGIGVLIAEMPERRKGYASEALRLFMDYCHQHLQLHSLYCNIFDNNEASKRLFVSAGFELVGTKKDWTRNGTRWMNECLYQIVFSTSS
jgi:diamine N-acetyltransferase